MPSSEQGGYVTHTEFGQFRDVVGQRFDNMERGMATQHRETMEAIKELRVAAAPKPADWKGAAAIAFGAFGVVIAFLAIYVRPFDAHMELPGHPEAMQLHSMYGERFETMRATDAALLEGINDNSERFETWIRRVEDRITIDHNSIAAASERLARLESMSVEWGDAREERHNIEARVRALEVGK